MLYAFVGEAASIVDIDAVCTCQSKLPWVSRAKHKNITNKSWLFETTLPCSHSQGGLVGNPIVLLQSYCNLSNSFWPTPPTLGFRGRSGVSMTGLVRWANPFSIRWIIFEQGFVEALNTDQTRSEVQKQRKLCFYLVCVWLLVILNMTAHTSMITAHVDYVLWQSAYEFTFTPKEYGSN